MSRPLFKRLLILLVLGLGFALILRTNAPERELMWWLEGPGWSDIRTLEFQVKAADGELVKRQVYSFPPQGPPGALTMKTDLPSGQYEVWVFARGAEGPSRPPRVERLTLGDEDTQVQRGLRVPASR